MDCLELSAGSRLWIHPLPSQRPLSESLFVEGAFPAFVGSLSVIVAFVILAKVVPLVLGLKIAGLIGYDVDPPNSAFEV